MATKYSNPPLKLPKIMGFSLPKAPLGRSMSGASASRASASGYGKLAKLAGGTTVVKTPKVSL